MNYIKGDYVIQNPWKLTLKLGAKFIAPAFVFTFQYLTNALSEIQHKQPNFRVDRARRSVSNY